MYTVCVCGNVSKKFWAVNGFSWSWKYLLKALKLLVEQVFMYISEQFNILI